MMSGEGDGSLARFSAEERVREHERFHVSVGVVIGGCRLCVDALEAAGDDAGRETGGNQGEPARGSQNAFSSIQLELELDLDLDSA